MKVSQLAHAYSAIENTRSRREITTILSDLFSCTDPNQALIIARLSRGQLYPPYSNKQFFIADKIMIRILAHFFHEKIDIIQEYFKQIGDLGNILDRFFLPASSSYTLTELYKDLTILSEFSGQGSQEEKIKYTCSILEKLDALSARYVVRIITGKLRLGFSDMTIIDALSAMLAGNKSLRVPIEDAYNRCADSGLVAFLIKKDGIEAMYSAQITVGIPLVPAAAERLASAQAIIDKIGPAVVQPKLDGFRLQIHINKKEINFFSRNLINMSSQFPELTHACQQLSVDTLICEGEAITYDAETGRFLPFQETAKRKRKHDIDITARDFPLKIFLFDILYLNGKSLIELSHMERRLFLIELMQDYKGSVINLIDEKIVETGDKLESYFLAAVSEGLEGVIVKKPDAPYQPGKRNFNWIKLKRMYAGHLDDTIDCVILGYYYGEGKRSTWGIGAFLVGIYNKNKDVFETIAKIGTGLSDAQWKELKDLCDTRTLGECSSQVICPPELTPPVWIVPDIVCAILADEISLSPLHTAGKVGAKLGYALRFPRFIDYRPDKSAYQATTIDEIKQLYHEQFHHHASKQP